MTGIEYFRLKRRMSVKALTAAAHLGATTVTYYEHLRPEQMQVPVLLKISRALDVPIDDLIKEYDERLLEPGDHHTHTRNISLGKTTPLANYRRAKNLTVAQLAGIAGCSKQNISRACIEGGHRNKLVRRICEYENIDRETFDRLYGSGVTA